MSVLECLTKVWGVVATPQGWGILCGDVTTSIGAFRQQVQVECSALRDAAAAAQADAERRERSVAQAEVQASSHEQVGAAI